jgi:hypothetical protein
MSRINKIYFIGQFLSNFEVKKGWIVLPSKRNDRHNRSDLNGLLILVL